jgi:hypothetical protein
VVATSVEGNHRRIEQFAHGPAALAPEDAFAGWSAQRISVGREGVVGSTIAPLGCAGDGASPALCGRYLLGRRSSNG